MDDIPLWSDLLPPLLEMIACRLSAPDYASFTAVCKSWRSITGPIYSQKSCIPLLLHRQVDEDNHTCFLYSPLTNKTFGIDMPYLAGAEIQYSKDGWVIATRTMEVFVLNPITGEKYDLPPFEAHAYVRSMCFSMTPTQAVASSTSWMVIVIIATKGWINSYYCILRYGEDDDWIFYPESDMVFTFSQSSPVFLDGVFYCMDRIGRLGVANPSDMSWSILPRPQHVVTSGVQVKFSYLMEFKGELYSMFDVRAFKDECQRPPQIYKLDRSCMEWREVKSLENVVVFANLRTVIMVDATHAPMEMENRIYYSRKHGKRCTPIPIHPISYRKNYLFFTPLHYSKTEEYNGWQIPISAHLCKKGKMEEYGERSCRRCCNHADEPVFFSLDERRLQPTEDFYLSRHYPNSIWFAPHGCPQV